MKLSYLWICLLFSISNIEAFLPSPHKGVRRFKLQYALYIRKNENVLIESKTRVLDNMAMIIKDDLSNDLLYYLKFYHLTQDDVVNYFYIIFYELLSLMLRSEKNKLDYLPISMVNMCMYIAIKNVLLNQYLHHNNH
tara:strand:+ start:1947 stop:2357 length:411 start_codon:yes stop_codon:yes gene_type:complete